MKHPHLRQTKNAIATQGQHEAIAQKAAPKAIGRSPREAIANHPETATAPLQPQTPQHSPHPIEELQGLIGNHAVNQLLAGEPLVQTKPLFRGLSHELAIQPKLTIGAPGDKYEQEADSIAEQVVSQMNGQENSQIHRKPTPEEDEELQMKPIVQRLGERNIMTAAPEFEASIQEAKSGGQPLENTIREPMEQAFGADFSGVKVHTDTQSHQLNRSINAQAFTTGQNIFFRQDVYSPNSREGQELLAHELTHVVQQNSRQNGEVETKSTNTISSIQNAPTSIQAKLGRQTRVQANSQPLKTWKFEKNQCQISIELYQAQPNGIADLTWQLILYENNEKQGYIRIDFHRNMGILKPDNLSVNPDGLSKGYGGILGEYVVMAMKEPSIQAATKTQGERQLVLDLVNPISAHISVKALNSTMNNSQNIEDSEAQANAQTALDNLEIASEGYKTENFPRFWGWIVNLAKNHGVEFQFSFTSTYRETNEKGETEVKTKPFPKLNKDTNFDLDLARKLLGWLATIKITQGKAKHFTLNVYSPLPRINEDNL